MANTKIAIISDLHGNLEATKKVFEDIKKRNINKIICLGDLIAKGNHPNECIDLVRENCFIVLKGNTDRHFTQEHDFTTLSEISQKRIKWNQSLLTDENKNYLISLPFCHEFYMSGSLVRLFHASPTRDDEFISGLDKVALKSKMFKPSELTVSDKNADVVIYGHLHHQYLDKLYNKTLISVGSVGNPVDIIRKKDFDSDVKETTNVHYLIIEGEYEKETYDDLIFQFIRIPYDICIELECIDDNLEPDDYRCELEEGKYRDMTKIDQSFKDRDVILD